MSKRWQSLGQLREDDVDEGRLAHNLRRVRQRQDRQRRRRERVTGTALGLVVAVVLFLAGRGAIDWAKAPGALVSHSRDADRCLRAAGVTCAAEQYDFDDGSRISTGEGTRLELVRNTGTQVRSVLRQGWARFSVEPGGPRRWIVDAGLVQVEVVGTGFTVSRDARGARVQVHHGKVRVRGSSVRGGSVFLGAGQSLTVQNDADRPIPETASPKQTAGRAEVDVPVTTPALPTSPRPVATPDVFARVDALRARGEHASAAVLLQSALASHGAAHERGMLALTLAELQLDTLAQASEAATSFEVALQGKLPPALREQASARRIEALVRADLRGQAVRACEEYTRLYPNGRLRSEVAHWKDLAEAPR